MKECQEAEKSCLKMLVHDLKTPTNSQLSTLKMLESGTFGGLNEEQEKIIRLMSDSCKYMTSLIGLILKAYSDLDKIELNKTTFDITGLISGLCGEIRSLVMEKGQDLIFHNFTENSVIFADKLQIRRVILNLLSNAVMYGFCGTKIEITLKVSGGSCEFFVENYSKQISSEELVKVFDKYSKTVYSHFNKAGTGLGLYLVKQVIEKHNGRVYAKSEADGKCTFGFIIPNSVTENRKCRSLREEPASANSVLK